MIHIKCPRCDRYGNIFDVKVDPEKKTYQAFAECPSCLIVITAKIQYTDKPPGDLWDVIGVVNNGAIP